MPAPKPDHSVINPEAVPLIAALETDPSRADSIVYASGNQPLHLKTAFPELTTPAVDGGPSYRILHTQVGEFSQGEICTFDSGIDVQRLLRIGAIEEVN